MDAEFLKKVSGYNDDQLKDVLENRQDYAPEAVVCVQEEFMRRGGTEGFSTRQLKCEEQEEFDNLCRKELNQHASLVKNLVRKGVQEHVIKRELANKGVDIAVAEAIAHSIMKDKIDVEEYSHARHLILIALFVVVSLAIRACRSL